MEEEYNMSYTTKAITVALLATGIASLTTGWKAHATREGTLKQQTQDMGVQALIQLDQEHPNYDYLGRVIKSVGANTKNGKALIKWAEAHAPVYMNYDGKTFIGCKKDRSEDARSLNIAVAETVMYWEYKEPVKVHDLAYFDDRDEKAMKAARKDLNDEDYTAYCAHRRERSATLAVVKEQEAA